MRGVRARLIKPAFEIDLEHFLNCGAQLKITVAIFEATLIERNPHNELAGANRRFLRGLAV